MTATSQELIEVTRKRYTDPVTMLDHLDRFRPLRRLEEALRAREIAARPDGRFGLDSVDCLDVLRFLDGTIIALRAALAPLRDRARELDVPGTTWGEILGDLMGDPRFASLDVGDVSIGFVTGRIRGL